MWRFKCEIIVIFSMNNLGISLLESPVVVRCPLLPACYLPHRFFAAFSCCFRDSYGVSPNIQFDRINPFVYIITQRKMSFPNPIGEYGSQYAQGEDQLSAHHFKILYISKYTILMDNHLLPMSPRATRLGLGDHIVDLGNVDGISFDILQNGKQKMQPQSFICVVVEQPVLGLQFQDGGEDGGGDCEEGRLCASAEDERPVDLLLGEEGEVSDFVVLVEEVGVGQLVLALLVGGVEELEDLLADEGVGAVDEEDEFVDFAVPLGNGVEVLDVADLLVSVDDDVVDLLDPGLLPAELDVLLLVLLHDHGLDGIEVPRLLLGGLVDVDQVVVVVVLHEEGAEVGGAVRVVLEVVGDYTEGLLLVIDYIVLFLIVFQLFVGQVRKYLHVLLANPLPLLRQQHLLLRNYRLGLPGLLQVHLHVGDVPRVGGALEGDELGDVVADVEDHLGVDDDEEEEEDAEDQQVEVAVLAEVAQELLVAVGLPHFQCHFFSLQEHAYFELKPCAYYYSCLNYS